MSNATLTTLRVANDPGWKRILARDKMADGLFDTRFQQQAFIVGHHAPRGLKIRRTCNFTTR
jgi:hypothetical protein